MLRDLNRHRRLLVVLGLVLFIGLFFAASAQAAIWNEQDWEVVWEWIVRCYTFMTGGHVDW